MNLKKPNPLQLLKMTNPQDYDFKMNSGFFGKKHPSFAFALVAGTYPVLLFAFIFVALILISYFWS